MRRCEPQLTAGTAVLTSQHAGAIRRVGEDKTPRDHPGEACSRKLPQHSRTPAPRRGRVVGAHALIRHSTLGGGQTLGVGWGGLGWGRGPPVTTPPTRCRVSLHPDDTGVAASSPVSGSGH